jgi:hypothetical protein
VAHLTAVWNLFCTQVLSVCTVTAPARPSVRPSVALRTSETNNNSGKVCVHKLLVLGRTEHDRRTALLLRAMGTYGGKHHSIIATLVGYEDRQATFLQILAHTSLHADTSFIYIYRVFQKELYNFESL